MKKNWFVIFILLVLSIPTFFRMIRPGIYSMQDPHLFRMYEYDRCARDLQIPCRWAPDSGIEYGEPVFNFYTQIPYAIGEIIHLLGFQLIDSIKIVFVLTLILSGVGMYLLANRVWNNKYAALVSSILYIYAPYRAVDVWVRAALPEAFAFILFPLIAYFAYGYLLKKSISQLVLFSASLSLLILTHNLSLIMFSVFLVPWMVYQIIKLKKFKVIVPLSIAAVFSLLLAAFYLLPVVFESKYVNLASTTQGYFDFRAHFATVNELLISRFWGYGASLFGPKDDLSLSVGQIHWLLPLIALIGLGLSKNKNTKEVLILLLIGWFALFMTHNKSALIWENLKFLSYLQFPWRWLSIAVFSFSLAAGAIVFVLKKKQIYVASLVILAAIMTNFMFFREDIWYNITDKEQFSGEKWIEQTSSSLGDYWPIFAKELPAWPNPQQPQIENNKIGTLVGKTSKTVTYKFHLSMPSEVEFPVAYFPGWHLYLDGKEYPISPSGDLGLISSRLPGFTGDKDVNLVFSDTPVRRTGNIITLVSGTAAILFLAFKRYV